MLPISVFIPVPVTIISPRPRVTDVFMNTMPSRSPSGTSSRSIVATSLRTGVLSPVSAASSISSVAATNSRPSAGTRLPASISTTSPGTSSAASISTDRAITAHAGDVLQHLLERGEARLGLRFLTEAEHGVEDGEPEQHEGRAGLAGHDLVHDRGSHEDDLHQVLVLPQEGVQRRFLGLAGELVGPVPGLAFADLARGQPSDGVDVEQLGGFVGGLAIPGGRSRCLVDRGHAAVRLPQWRRRARRRSDRRARSGAARRSAGRCRTARGRSPVRPSRPPRSG